MTLRGGTPDFELVHRAHARAVLRVCRRQLRGRLAMLAEDAAQETWICALDAAWPGAMEQPEAPRRLVLRIARRRCADIVRKEFGRRGQRRQESLEQVVNLGGHRDPRPGALDVVLAGERDRRVRSALRRLTRRQRAAVRGLYFDDRTEREVGAGLGVSESRVSYLKSEALAALRRRMVAA